MADITISITERRGSYKLGKVQLSRTIKWFGKLNQKEAQFAGRATYFVSKKLLQYIRYEIQNLPRINNNPLGHNTPSPLINIAQDGVAIKKITKANYIVSLSRQGRGVDPLWIENGTVVRQKPHAKPNPFFKRGVSNYVQSGHLRNTVDKEIGKALVDSFNRLG